MRELTESRVVEGEKVGRALSRKAAGEKEEEEGEAPLGLDAVRLSCCCRADTWDGGACRS